MDLGCRLAGAAAIPVTGTRPEEIVAEGRFAGTRGIPCGDPGLGASIQASDNVDSQKLELSWRRRATPGSPMTHPVPEPALPDRPELERRLHELQNFQKDLEERIAEDERPPGPLRSPLRTKRDEVLARLADLRRRRSGITWTPPAAHCARLGLCS